MTQQISFVEARVKSTMILSEVVFVLLVGFDIGYGDVVSRSMVTLRNNRYSRIVIAINPGIKEDAGLVDAIKVSLIILLLNATYNSDRNQQYTLNL